MFYFRFLAASALLAAVAASPIATSHSVHERLSRVPSGWVKRDVLDRRAVLPMKVGLTQSNLDKGADWLQEVSDPHSPKYGQHWTAEEVAEAFAPTPESVAAVQAWLSSSGIPECRVTQTQGRGWLEFDATADEAEELLRTKYHVYERETGQEHVACEEYSIPAHLKGHIDLIFPTVYRGANIKPRHEATGLEKRHMEPGGYKARGKPGNGSLPEGDHMMARDDQPSLDHCGQDIDPDCLRALYKIPDNNNNNGYQESNNSYGILAYTTDAYRTENLDPFFRRYSPSAVGARPIIHPIRSVPKLEKDNSEVNEGDQGEIDLDVQYAITLVHPQPVTLYQVGDAHTIMNFDYFLEAIDSAYCSKVDPTLREDCGDVSPPKVFSTSFAFNEHRDLTPAYEERQCAEYLKLGLLGVSVLYGSGDTGVAGAHNQCIDGDDLSAGFTNGTSGRFNPSFPSTCPWLTSVGATQIKPLKPGTSIADLAQPEMACESVIHSGGGFSDVFPIPDYQLDAVKKWFKDSPPPYGPDRFNNTQEARGFPDISVMGAVYPYFTDGRFLGAAGTSASTPTLGAILTLINQERYKIGKRSIGFINYAAYRYPEMFNDITEGGNPGCGTPGFQAAPGWDPVTGLGTPDYEKMVKLFTTFA